MLEEENIVTPTERVCCVYELHLKHTLYILFLFVMLAVPFCGAQNVLFNVCKHFRISF